MSNPLALIVDDDSGLSDAFALALERVGFDTEKLNDSTQAITIIGIKKPDLVTLDMQMPIVSGAEILRQIRADARIKSTKVILITANPRIGENEELAGMADVILIKPITLAQIKELAARLVQPIPDQS